MAQLADQSTRDYAIKTDNLQVTYSDGTQAVTGISLEIHGGEFFGFLRPNGAGKTTIKVLTTLLSPIEPWTRDRRSLPSMRTTEILDGDDVVQAMNDGLLFILQQAFNQQEIVQISSRIRQGLAEKQRREEPIGRPPFGLTTDKQRDNEDIATEFVPDENFETGLSILDAFDEAAGITPESDQSPSAYEVGKRHGLSSPSKLVEWIWDRRDLYRETDSEVGSS